MYANAHKVFLFDVDGTLTLPQQEISQDHAGVLYNMAMLYPVYLITGSTYEMLQDQIPGRILRQVEGVFTCAGNVLHRYGKLLYEHKGRGWLRQSILDLLSEAFLARPCPGQVPDPLFFRPGMLNICPIGRPATTEARETFARWDEKNGWRQWLVHEILMPKCPELDIRIGGQVSIDVSPRGHGKGQVVPMLVTAYPNARISFFGDKLNPGGNDHDVLAEASNLGVCVTGVPVRNAVETFTILRDILNGGNEYEKAVRD